MHHKYPPPDKTGDLKKKKMQTPEDMLYYDKNGVYLPSDNLRMMLIGNKFRKGAGEIVGSRVEAQKGRFYKDFCKACVWVVGEKDPLKVYYIPSRKTMDATDIRSFLTSKGGRDITERPIIELPWALEFLVQITEEIPPMTADKVKELFEFAGLHCGAGAYGPTFGRFMVKKWDVVK
jgi:hypothetical protein